MGPSHFGQRQTSSWLASLPSIAAAFSYFDVIATLIFSGRRRWTQGRFMVFSSAGMIESPWQYYVEPVSNRLMLQPVGNRLDNFAKG
jgi:hypothetical protein